MLHDALRQGWHWCAGAIVAALAAAALAALATPGAAAGAGPYLNALFEAVLRLGWFDFGASVISGAPALASAWSAMAASATLTLPALLIAVPFGAALAILLTHPATRSLASPLVQAIGAVPMFAAALFFAPVFGSALMEGAPAAGSFAGGVAPLVWLIGLAGAGAIAASLSRALRAAMREPYCAGLARLGLPRGEILTVYVARQALGTAAKDAGEIVLVLITAAALVEWVFAWPGAGTAFFRSLALHDWPLAAAIAFLFALLRLSLGVAGALASRALLGPEPR